MGWLRDPAPGAGAVAGARVGARPGTDFRYRAACRSVDPEVFFPTAVRGAVFAVQVAAAKAVCAGCPVQAECLTWALTALSDGVAGGMTDQERRGELARRRGASPRRVPRRPVGGTPAEVTAAGRAAVAAGMSVGEAVREFGVSTRTADRWVRAARIRPTHEITAAPVAVAGLDGAA